MFYVQPTIYCLSFLLEFFYWFFICLTIACLANTLLRSVERGKIAELRQDFLHLLHNLYQRAKSESFSA
jgi:hypothetical protein